MGKITIILNDELEQKLRVAIASKGGKKGDLTKSIEEGIRLWLKMTEQTTK